MKIYIFSRAKLLLTVWDEIPCSYWVNYKSLYRLIFAHFLLNSLALKFIQHVIAWYISRISIQAHIKVGSPDASWAIVLLGLNDGANLGLYSNFLPRVLVLYERPFLKLHALNSRKIQISRRLILQCCQKLCDPTVSPTRGSIWFTQKGAYRNVCWILTNVQLYIYWRCTCVCMYIKRDYYMQTTFS